MPAIMISAGDFLQLGKQFAGDSRQMPRLPDRLRRRAGARRRTPRAGSSTSGSRPRNGTPSLAADASAPPCPNGSLVSPQCGHWYPAIFSMMPSTGTLVLPNRSIARVASISDRSCGVETITAPAGRDFWTSDSWTSPVPGGRSTRIRSPHRPSLPRSAGSTRWTPSARATPAPYPADTSCPTDK